MRITSRHDWMTGHKWRTALVGLCWATWVISCTPTNNGTPMNGNTGGNGNANVNDNAPAAPVPVFPENYRATFTEVRDCRFSIEHGGFTIRVLANDVALEAYLADAAQLPVGSIIIKEEFGGPDCADDSVLEQWRVMRKEPPGFDPNAGDWHWQRVLANGRQVVEDSKASCIGCHSVPECFERDYQCTHP
jgi:hypothetical protein